MSRDLDIALAHKLGGNRKFPPFYHLDGNATMRLIAEMQAMGWSFLILAGQDGDTEVLCHKEDSVYRQVHADATITQAIAEIAYEALYGEEWTCGEFPKLENIF